MDILFIKKSESNKDQPEIINQLNDIHNKLSDSNNKFDEELSKIMIEKDKSYFVQLLYNFKQLYNSIIADHVKYIEKIQENHNLSNIIMKINKIKDIISSLNQKMIKLESLKLTDVQIDPDILELNGINEQIDELCLKFQKEFPAIKEEIKWTNNKESLLAFKDIYLSYSLEFEDYLNEFEKNRKISPELTKTKNNLERLKNIISGIEEEYTNLSNKDILNLTIEMNKIIEEQNKLITQFVTEFEEVKHKIKINNSLHSLMDLKDIYGYYIIDYSNYTKDHEKPQFNIPIIHLKLNEINYNIGILKDHLTELETEYLIYISKKFESKPNNNQIIKTNNSATSKDDTELEAEFQKYIETNFESIPSNNRIIKTSKPSVPSRLTGNTRIVDERVLQLIKNKKNDQ